ncbi:MAG TPA: hypothetical protein VGP83_17125 [Pyrinomonadaceae bacterium]|jgi:hypothetical protein|nr:hypothetical protein [Pyrinomonadaceae bacterium]
MQSRYPLDWELLQKGDVLDAETLKDITGKTPGSDEFRFACMGLQALIQEKTGFTVKLPSDNSLRVLTDPEAAAHNERLFWQFMRSMVTRHTLNCSVDVDNLEATQRAQHDRTLLAQSRYVSAVAQTTKEIVLARNPPEPEPLDDGTR